MYKIARLYIYLTYMSTCCQGWASESWEGSEERDLLGSSEDEVLIAGYKHEAEWHESKKR